MQKTCQDILENLAKIDRDVFPFLSLDETEMIVVFTKSKEKKIREYFKSLGLSYRIDKNQVYVKIKKVK